MFTGSTSSSAVSAAGAYAPLNPAADGATVSGGAEDPLVNSFAGGGAGVGARAGAGAGAGALGGGGGAPSLVAAARAQWAALSAPARLRALALAGAAVIGAGVGAGVAARGAGGGGGGGGAASYCGWASYRLPPNAAPLAYNVSWAPLLAPGGAAFVSPFTPVAGAVSVDVLLSAPSDCVVLHAGAGLALASVTAGGAAAAWARDAVFSDRVAIRLPPGAGGAAGAAVVRLALSFSFNASNNNFGLYSSSYLDDSGARVTALATQFEATYARTAFPCFDEPALKATFQLTVDGVPAGFTPLGNMPVAATRARADGAATVAFAPTPRMSTYLLAFVAAPLVGTTVYGVGAGAIPVTAWAVARGANAARVGYAAAAASVMIPFYEGLYGINFPLPKMDMVAIPDFAAGAMENWGLITYRETAMLANASTSSQAELQRVAVVVAHELAHQWFGDIVTMAWWDSLWLNEGGASRMEFLGTDAFDPGFGIARQFQSANTLRALRADSFSQVQQLTQAVDSSAAVEGMFSSISYAKGAAVLQALQAWLGAQGLPGAFFAGVNAYLLANLYGAAQPASLWRSLGAAAGVPQLAGWAQTYELQPGFPCVSLAWAAPPVGGRGALVFSQRRFFMSPASAAAAGPVEAGRLYWVPLTFSGGRAGGAAVPAAAAAARDAARAFTGPTWAAGPLPFDLALDGWLKVGANSTLYARVNYPPEVWLNLAAAAADAAAGRSSALPPADRAALLDDYVAFALAGGDFAVAGITPPAALAFAAAFMPSETSYEAVTVFVSAAGALASMLVPDVPLAQGGGDPAADPFTAAPGSRACFAAFCAYARAQLGAAQRALAWNATPGEAPLTTSLRGSVLSAASFFNDSSVVAAARAAYAAAGGDGGRLPPDLAGVVLQTVARFGGADVGLAMLAAYQAALAAGDAAGARRYLAAATASRDRGFLNAALALVLTDAVPVGDKVGLLAGVAGNAWGRDLAWAWLVARDVLSGALVNWNGLTALFPPGGFDMSAIVSALAGGFNSQEYADAVAAFWGPAAPQRPAMAGAVNDYVAAQEVVARAVAFRAAQGAATCAYVTAAFPPAAGAAA